MDLCGLKESWFEITNKKLNQQLPGTARLLQMIFRYEEMDDLVCVVNV